MQLARCGVPVMVGGQELRVGTSRFLAQGAFVVYKLALAVFFLGYAIYWAEGLRTRPFLARLTHQTWWITTAYFFTSATSALLCWRAINKAAGGSIAEGGSAADTEEGRGSAAQNGAEDSPALRKAETTEGCGSPVPLALRRLQLVVWNIACLVSLVVVSLFWVADYGGWAVTSVDILAHGAIAAVMLIDQFLVADDFKLRHVVFSQAYGLVYVLFTILWYYEGWEEKLLYKVLDWEDKPLVACIYSLGSILVLTPLFGLLHFFICSRRERLHAHLKERLLAERRSREFDVIGQASTSL